MVFFSLLVVHKIYLINGLLEIWQMAVFGNGKSAMRMSVIHLSIKQAFTESLVQGIQKEMKMNKTDP